jgi:protease-4
MIEERAEAGPGQAPEGERVQGEGAPRGKDPAPTSVLQSATQLQQHALLKLLDDANAEQRRRRRWTNGFRFAFLLLLLLFWFEWRILDGHDPGKPVRHTALIDIRGEIDHESEASADLITSALRAAFEDQGTAGVILRVNSPGGSPVQASIIHQEVVRLRGKYPDTPVHVVVEDICASGGYYIAVAADQIFVDRNSLVGSIGVRLDSFGFTEVMKRIGVERRLYTAGSDKAMLDPFGAISAEQKGHLQATLDALHLNFIDAVRAGRGERLKDDGHVFSGRVWSGDQAILLGLADARGTVDVVARDVIKAEEVVDFSPQPSLAERFARRVGVETSRVLARVGYDFVTREMRLR